MPIVVVEENVLEKICDEIRNDRGDKFTKLRQGNDYTDMNINFQLLPCRLYTRKSNRFYHTWTIAKYHHKSIKITRGD